MGKKVLWLAQEEVINTAHELHDKLRNQFAEADVENDEVLDIDQLASVFKKCYRDEKVSRRMAVVKEEVKEQ